MAGNGRNRGRGKANRGGAARQSRILGLPRIQLGLSTAGNQVGGAGFQAGGATPGAAGFQPGGATPGAAGFQPGGATVGAGFQASGATPGAAGFQPGGATVGAGFQAGGTGSDAGGGSGGGIESGAGGNTETGPPTARRTRLFLETEAVDLEQEADDGDEFGDFELGSMGSEKMRHRNGSSSSSSSSKSNPPPPLLLRCADYAEARIWSSINFVFSFIASEEDRALDDFIYAVKHQALVQGQKFFPTPKWETLRGMGIKVPAKKGMYLRACFWQLYDTIMSDLETCKRVYVDGLPGVGKSMFMWYVIIRQFKEAFHRNLIVEMDSKQGVFFAYGCSTFVKDFARSLPIPKCDPMYLIDRESRASDYRGVAPKIVFHGPEPGRRCKKGTFTVRVLPPWSEAEIQELQQIHSQECLTSLKAD